MRRRRRAAAAILVLVAALAVWVVTRGSGTPGPHGDALVGGAPTTGTPTTGTQTTGTPTTRTSASAGSRIPQGAPAPAVSGVLEHWRLPNPVTREGVVALGAGKLLVLGGLTAAGSSSTEVAVVDTATGAVSAIGTLAAPVHDAGASTLGGKALVFGGGQSTATVAVQAFPLSSGRGQAATVTGQLPQPRADDQAVTVGSTAYVVGGYDGTVGDAQVLATTDGATFTAVATLPVAVRYPAVAAMGGRIYIFGGEVVTGGTTLQVWTRTTQPPGGQQVPVVQVVDPATHRAWVAARMPHAVEGAAAFAIGGHLYVAGGDAYDPSSNPVSGSTVWSFDPRGATFAVAGHLAQPVAYAGVAAAGSSVWLIGGERDGTAVGTVQVVRLRHH